MGKFIFVFVVLLVTASGVFVLFPANNATDSSRVFSSNEVPGQEAGVAAEIREFAPQSQPLDEGLVANSEAAR